MSPNAHGRLSEDCSRRLRVVIAGLPFLIGPVETLSADEIAVLDRISLQSSQKAVENSAFQLTVRRQSPWPTEKGLHAGGAAAQITASQGNLLIHHRDFLASLDIHQGRGSLTRKTPLGFPLEICLRTALCALLPLNGGLALHSAGLIIDGAGLVFFGPSGAGKTSLAMATAFQVLSDELIAVSGAPLKLHSSGFWGEMGGEDKVFKREAPLIALVELAKSDAFSMTRLTTAQGLHRLIKVMVLPLEATLWKSGIRVLAGIVDQVPIWRMGWSTKNSPGPELEAFVRKLKSCR